MPEWAILAGYMFTIAGQIIALVVGAARLKRWFEKSVVDPYVKPIRDDVGTLKEGQVEDRALLRKHDKYIYLLLGKQFGGIPDIDGDL